MDLLTLWGLGKLASGFFGGIAKYKAGQSRAKADRYRASLADENARAADLLLLDREYRARKEGVLDAGLFRMKAEMSGLSGASRDIWVGQRYMDAYNDVTNARAARSQTVGRFLKEAGWHRKNAQAHESSAKWAVLGEVISTGTDLYEGLKK